MTGIVKRIGLVMAALLLLIPESKAVLKEKNLDETLLILKAELTKYDTELNDKAQLRNQRSKQFRSRLIEAMKEADQNALILYSQQSDYVFDLTYACHEATEQYQQFHRQQMPFTKFLSTISADLARYDSLGRALEKMPERVLSDKGRQNRLECMALTRSIHEKLTREQQQLNNYINYYKATEQRLAHLNDYAQKRYHDIQTSIFRNGGDNYWEIVTKFSRKWLEMKRVMTKKYNFEDETSQWSGLWIFGTFLGILIYVIIAIVLNQVFFRLLMPKRFDSEEFRKKRACIMMATTTVTFAIIQGLVINTTSQNFLIMASELLVEYAWLLGVILFSLLLRVSGEQIRSAFRVYAPLVLMGFVVIVFRIIMIPSELVNIIFPPILLASALWQWSVIRRHNRRVPRSDKMYSYCSLTIFIVAVGCSALGYTLLSVQVLIWWIMQLTCILTITCVSQYIRLYALRHGIQERPITETWFYMLVERVMMPVLSVGSVLLSVYWAAKVFNMNDLCWTIFNYHFIDLENLQMSIIQLSIVVALWFLFRYIANTILAFMRLHFQQSDPTTAASREVMGKNVIQVFVWGVWCMMSLSYLHISVAWLVAISGGLSTGIGFASKDIIENIYYGATLMAGRIKVGDWIEVDGRMGKVASISYTSTVVESLYGEVITFQNAQLFSKNYKNLTRNHGYVLAVVPFGVAYGSNLKQVTELVEAALNAMEHPWTDHSKRIKCVCSEMGDSSVNFKLFVWADAPKRSYVVSDVLKCVYDTLGKNDIQIPFPQRDIHIIK